MCELILRGGEGVGGVGLAFGGDAGGVAGRGVLGELVGGDGGVGVDEAGELGAEAGFVVGGACDEGEFEGSGLFSADARMLLWDGHGLWGGGDLRGGEDGGGGSNT